MGICWFISGGRIIPKPTSEVNTYCRKAKGGFCSNLWIWCGFCSILSYFHKHLDDNWSVSRYWHTPSVLQLRR
ncbi:MAG: hypothetical protein CVT98_03935, partial [Bacteroidetes bacterium HGW-Bacteroidetes-15]